MFDINCLFRILLLGLYLCMFISTINITVVKYKELGRLLQIKSNHSQVTTHTLVNYELADELKLENSKKHV